MILRAHTHTHTHTYCKSCHSERRHTLNLSSRVVKQGERKAASLVNTCLAKSFTNNLYCPKKVTLISITDAGHSPSVSDINVITMLMWFLPRQMNREKEKSGIDKTSRRERMDAEGEGAAGGPSEAGCDFNTWSLQSHYRPPSEEPRGQIWSKPKVTSANGILLSVSTPSVHTHPTPQTHTCIHTEFHKHTATPASQSEGPPFLLFQPPVVCICFPSLRLPLKWGKYILQRDTLENLLISGNIYHEKAQRSINSAHSLLMFDPSSCTISFTWIHIFPSTYA